jgi:hypothetical protein
MLKPVEMNSAWIEGKGGELIFFEKMWIQRNKSKGEL